MTLPRGAPTFCLLLLIAAAAPAETPKPKPAARFLLQWGRQGAEPGQFNIPIGIAISRDDAVFITDHYNSRVQKFDAQGKLLAHFGVLPNPGGIAIDATDNLVVSHFSVSRLRKDKTPDRVSLVSPTGKLLREWGKSGKGPGEFDMPGGVAVARDGRIYVADQTNRRVQVFDGAGKYLAQWGEYGILPGQFGGNAPRTSRVGGPQFVALDRAGNVFTTEASLGRIQQFTADGKLLRHWGDKEDRPGGFGRAFSGFKTNLSGPIALAIDRQDRLWITAAGGRVQLFTADGKHLGGIGESEGEGPGQFYGPHGVALDSRGCLYVVDSYNHRVQKFAVER